MKKAKLFLALFVVIVAALAGVVVFQNIPYLIEKRAFTFTISLMDFFNYHYNFPAIENGLYFIGCFFAGLLLAYATLLKSLFNSKQTIKALNQTIETDRKKISSLNQQMDKNDTPVPAMAAGTSEELAGA